MARAVATVIENNFVKGLITEANALKFPENSCVSTYDCIFDLLGSVSRRPGFDYEFGAQQKVVDKTASAINTFHWKNVSGDGLVSFLVVQIGHTLYFYSSTDGATSLSGSIAAGTVSLSTFQAAGSSTIDTFECQFSDGLSKLYVVHPCLNNFYITYVDGNFITTAYTLEIRDFEGVADPNRVDQRPTTLTVNDLHRYNLYNQGWPTDHLYIDTFQTATGFYPSNADVWWIYKDLNGTFNPAVTFANNTRGNAQAPQGHFILPLYTGDRATAAGLSGIDATSAGAARTSSTSFFAGRVWYSGVQAAGFNSKIYFTQIIRKNAQVGHCYQAADPTDEVLFNLLPDDGGVISIPECGTVYKLFAMQNILLVFAYRGVWMITGSSGLGFSATDYVVSRLSSIRTNSATSFVDVDGRPIWWNIDGIWTIKPTQSGGFEVVSMTFSTIQTFYDDIPTSSKLFARGAYNHLTKIVTWLYRSTEAATIEESYEFDRVMNYNTLSEAFYPWTISDGVSAHAVNVIDGTGGTSVTVQVIDNVIDDVIDDAGELIVGFDLQNIAIANRTKYLISKPSGLVSAFTFAETEDQTFEDWASAGVAVSYESTFITGYKLHGNANKNFQSNYLTIYNEGFGQFYIQGVWDYSTSADNGRYTSRHLATFSDNNYSNKARKLKIRGQGRSLQYKVTSYPGLDFNIQGWATMETGNTTV